MKELLIIGRALAMTAGRIVPVGAGGMTMAAAKTALTASDNPSIVEIIIGGVVIAGLIVFLIVHKTMQKKKSQSDNTTAGFETPNAKKGNGPGKKGGLLGKPFGGKKPVEESVEDSGVMQAQNGFYTPNEGMKVVQGENLASGMEANSPTIDLSTYMAQQQQQEAGSTVQPPVIGSAYVIGASGPMYGISYWINENGVTFGRDPSCNFAFAGDDTSISRFHCIVYSAEGMICIMDNASTNGTFLADGHRLQPNVPEVLKVGTQFYLGTPDNMFEIRTRA